MFHFTDDPDNNSHNSDERINIDGDDLDSIRDSINDHLDVDEDDSDTQQ